MHILHLLHILVVVVEFSSFKRSHLHLLADPVDHSPPHLQYVLFFFYFLFSFLYIRYSSVVAVPRLVLDSQHALKADHHANLPTPAQNY